MSPTIEELGLDRLPIDERVRLVQALWDSIAAEPTQVMLTEPQRRELERRIKDSREHPEAATPWEQVKAEALRRLQP